MRYEISLLPCYQKYVAIEPHLQPLKKVKAFTTNLPTLMRIHVSIYMHARVFWNRGQDAYFDVRVFHPNAPSYRSMNLPAIYHRHESEKKATI